MEHDISCLADAVRIGPAGIASIVERGGDPNQFPQPCTCGLDEAIRAAEIRGATWALMEGCAAYEYLRNRRGMSGAADAAAEAVVAQLPVRATRIVAAARG